MSVSKVSITLLVFTSNAGTSGSFREKVITVDTQYASNETNAQATFDTFKENNRNLIKATQVRGTFTNIVELS